MTTVGPAATAASAVAVQLVDDCVDFVQFGAFTGNPLLLGMWNEASQDVSTLRNNCDELGRTNLVGLQGLSAQWTDLEASMSASQTTPASIATVPPTLPPPPVPTAPPTLPTEPPNVEPEPASACDSNYSGCVPIASDVDCLGGTGNGPAYVAGPVYVIGTDIYGLDGNPSDGVGCE